jgi:hypothetical protein
MHLKLKTLVITCCIGLPAAAEDAQRHTLKGVSIVAPADYNTKYVEETRFEEAALKFTQGPSEQELSLLIESGELDVEDVELFDDITTIMPVRTLNIAVTNIPADAIKTDLPPIERDTDLYERFAGGFTDRWGGTSFCHIHDDAFAVSCINTTGAVIAGHTKMIGQHLITIEAIDFSAWNMIDQDTVYSNDFENKSKAERLIYLADVVLLSEAIAMLESARIVE